MRRQSNVHLRASAACGAWLAVAASIAAPAPARAYNDEQHQGMVALAYKAMVAATLEEGSCGTPIPFGGSAPPGLRTFTSGMPCLDLDLATCEARWQQYLAEIGSAVRRLGTITAGLPGPKDGCTDPRGTLLKNVKLGVLPNYARAEGCSVDQNADGCSSVARLCHSGSIYRYLAPDDHTGDTLGYWATDPDHDASVTALGFKPINAGAIGRTVAAANDVLEPALAAVAVPFVCLVEFLFGGSDCLSDARSLADTVVPIDELSSVVPVIGHWENADALTGLWHFIQTGSPASNECDDRQGVLYTEAGPGRPDEIDLAFVALADILGLTVNFDESEGPKRFNITQPNDGDAPSCRRGQADWEFETFPHTPFSPLDNLALWGWKSFAGAAGGARLAAQLGWPLHALGDAVAPHHVAGTTGWGHRPFEDAAEELWPALLYQDDEDAWGQQYEQLRRILHRGFRYAQALAEFRATRPANEAQNAIPIRALVTKVATDTRDEVAAIVGPGWPYKAGVSVPYVLPNLTKTGDRPIAVELYGGEITRTRALLERGAGAIAAFLSSVPRVIGSDTTGAVCSDGGGGAVFGSCGAFAVCASGCCIPPPILCDPSTEVCVR